ncbi:MAG: nickel pincer cofactor biosynthesis protein LarB [bacterium]|nr:nickel pincer cofactor biosynthesis protein LarB [bacterium]
MKRADLEHLAKHLRAGRLSLHEFADKVTDGFKSEPAEPAPQKTPETIDLDRQERCGFPEVVYGEGKSPESIIRIFKELLAAGMPALATRVRPEQAIELEAVWPTGVYHQIGRTFHVACEEPIEAIGNVAVVSAGTSDLPVVEEAAQTLSWMNVPTTVIHDVGVAGPHRIVPHVPALREMDAVIVVAGMEGALPSVVGGYVACPVIAAPTSVGYGASLGGIAALLGMLNSCASNVTVVNIDAGFKAGYLAGLIARRAHGG